MEPAASRGPAPHGLGDSLAQAATGLQAARYSKRPSFSAHGSLEWVALGARTVGPPVRPVPGRGQA